jgi:hypothetical protein
MIPLSPAALVGIPFGLWAWGLLSRRDTNLVVEEEKRLREKEVQAQRLSLRDQESMWYDLGAIAGHFLRDATTRWIIGAAASLVYLICLVMFFSFHGERVSLGDVLVNRFSAGQPSPWLTVEASVRGHRWSINWICWANVFALLGVGALQIARQIEKLQTGKMHAMAWHYAMWGVMFAVVLTLGLSNLFVQAPGPTPKHIPAAPSEQPKEPASLQPAQ